MTIRLLGSLASARVKAGDLAGGVELYTRVGRVREANRGLGDPNAVMAWVNAASAMVDLGRYSEAAVLLERVEAGAVGLLPDGHWQLGRLLVQRGRCAVGVDDHASAVGLFEDGICVLLGTFSPDDPRVVSVVERLVAACEASGSPERGVSVRSWLDGGTLWTRLCDE